MSQRVEEIKHEKGNEMTLSYDADDSLRIDNLDKLLQQTSQLLNMFNETKIKQFLLIYESERYDHQNYEPIGVLLAKLMIIFVLQL